MFAHKIVAPTDAAHLIAAPATRVLVVSLLAAAAPVMAQQGARARDLGVPFDGSPGPLNAITDVSGVRVAHTTLIRGEGELRVGEGPVRTGVTVIFPRQALQRRDPEAR